jgi:imidazole glycerol-phosphate synthase subunit HisH
MTRITVVDYGLGNLFSVARAFRAIGADVAMASTPGDVARADRLVLPGVGAFRDGMRGLAERGLVGPIHDHVQRGRPLFGICLGMQLLMDEGTEFGETAGLGLLPGRVVAFGSDGHPVGAKVPHVGWSRLRLTRAWTSSALSGVAPGSSVYFSHSYFPAPADPGLVLATATHGAVEFCAFLRRDNVQASQFHPDMSGSVGLAIAKAFVETT